MFNRRDFLKSLTWLGAGYAFLPRVAKGMNAGSVHVYVPDIDGKLFTGSTIDVYDASTNALLGTGKTTNSEANIGIVVSSVGDGKDNSGLLETVNIKGDNTHLNIQYPVLNDTDIRIKIYDMNGREILTFKDYQTRGNHQTQIPLQNLATGTYPVIIQTRDYMTKTAITVVDRTLRGVKSPTHINVQTSTPTLTTKLNKIGSGEYKFIVSNSAQHFKRTFYASASDNIEDRVVGYVDQPNVTPQLFRDLAYQANLKQGTLSTGYEGLKTFLQQSNKKILIVNQTPIELKYGFTVSSQDQEFVRNIILNDVFPAITSSYRPGIELIVQTERLPQINQPGTIVIYPLNGFVNGPVDDNADGIVDRTYVFFESASWQDRQNSSIHARLGGIATGIFGINRVLNTPKFSGISIVNEGDSAVLNFTSSDKKIIRMTEYFKPKTLVDDVLGLY